MGSLKRRLRKLEKIAENDTTRVVCPECREEFTLYGDPALAFLVHDWEQSYEGETYGPPTDPAVVRLAEHEHDPSRFIDKATGGPWLSEFFLAMEPTMIEPTDDLTE